MGRAALALWMVVGELTYKGDIYMKWMTLGGGILPDHNHDHSH